MQIEKNKLKACHGSLPKFEKVHGHGVENAKHMEPRRK
jgi:hypothetical protein